MSKKIYKLADTTHVYYYTLSGSGSINGPEYQAANKQELEQVLKSGKVLTYRVETNKFYFSDEKQGDQNGTVSNSYK